MTNFDICFVLGKSTGANLADLGRLGLSPILDHLLALSTTAREILCLVLVPRRRSPLSSDHLVRLQPLDFATARFDLVGCPCL